MGKGRRNAYREHRSSRQKEVDDVVLLPAENGLQCLDSNGFQDPQKAVRTGAETKRDFVAKRTTKAIAF